LQYLLLKFILITPITFVFFDIIIIHFSDYRAAFPKDCKGFTKRGLEEAFLAQPDYEDANGEGFMNYFA